MKFIYETNSLKSGIYKITNTFNGRFYIGSAKEFKSRWKGHEYSLRKNKHSNKFLQADYNKCGSDMFEFTILEIVVGNKSERLKKEELYIKKHYDNQEICYNLCKTAFSPEGTFRKDSEERKNKRSKAFKNTWANPANRKSMINKLIKRSANPEYKLNQSIATKTQWSFQKDKMSNAIKIGRQKNAKEYFFISPEGIEHKGSNILDFAKKMNLDFRALCEVVSGKALSHKGWRDGNKYQGSFNKVLHKAITHTTEKYKNISIISEDGIILSGSLPEVAHKAGLIAKSLSAVIRGDKKSLRGWKIYSV